MTSTEKVVAQAKALAGDRKLMESASVDLQSFVATFEARAKADGDDHVGTVAAATTVLAFATDQGLKVPAASASRGSSGAAKKTAASRAASGGRSGGSAGAKD